MKILCVGRGFMGRALARFAEFDVISHGKFIENPDVVGDYEGVVNTAGIIGHRKCDAAGYNAVIEANVKFAVTVQRRCEASGIFFIQPSTVGMSLRQSSLKPDVSLDELMPVYPHNLYCASKILCEHAVIGRNTTVFRLPWIVVPGTFESRIENWKEIQGTYCSVLELGDLRTAICNSISKRVVGLFHLKSEDVYFPDYIKAHFGLDLPIRKTGPEDMTASVPMDCSRAERAGMFKDGSD